MSRVAGSSTDASSGAKVAVASAFVLAMAVIVVLLVRARPAPEPFDPRSGQADGTRALVIVLERFGGTVDVARTAPADPSATLLVVDDRLDDEQRSSVLDFVEAGGVVVVADPDSSLHGGSGLDGGALAIDAPPLPDERLDAERESNVMVGECTIDGLDRLRGLHVPDGVLFPVGPDEPRCFARDGHSFVISRRLGQGTVVGLGDNEILTNRHLRRADNAGLAVALLAPEPGARVTVLVGTGSALSVDDLGEGDDTLFDLVPPWVWMSLTLAALGAMVFAASRASRVGRIVSEPVATPVAGSELVAATGNLMERARHAPRAASLILSRLRADLARAHGAEPTTPVDELDAAIARRHGIARGEVVAILGSTAHDDASLRLLADRADDLRRRTLVDEFGPTTGVDPNASAAPAGASDQPAGATEPQESVTP